MWPRSHATPPWTKRPFRLEARFVERLWGGSRFPATGNPIGEVWLVHELNIIASGDAAGMSLAEATRIGGESMLGDSVWGTGERTFPLLLKLIDAREWLSIQVHPDDSLALELEGAGHRGKTEAWYAIETEPGAEIISGVTPGTSPSALSEAIRNSTIESIVQRFPFHKGDVVALPAGTVHALGPEIFIYEIQQSSDTTYRVYDWDRPAATGRALHLEESVRAANSSLAPVPNLSPDLQQGEAIELVFMKPFVLSKARAGAQAFVIDPHGRAFQMITVVEGEALVESNGERFPLLCLETLVIPAQSAPCHITAAVDATVLIAEPQ